jgi:hypothetical protein
MLSYKFDITDCSNPLFISNKQQEYSYAFRKLYKNINLIKNKEFLGKLAVKYNLDAYLVYCLIQDVETKFK